MSSLTSKDRNSAASWLHPVRDKSRSARRSAAPTHQSPHPSQLNSQPPANRPTNGSPAIRFTLRKSFRINTYEIVRNSVDSTRLTETLNPLDATLTKLLGEGVVMTQQWHRLQSVRSPFSHGQSVSMSV
jgi:hypothetical protein